MIESHHHLFLPIYASHNPNFQVLTWGVRHMKKFQLAAVNSPSIEIECGGVILSTVKIKNAKKNPNFDTPSMVLDVVSVGREMSGANQSLIFVIVKSL